MKMDFLMILTLVILQGVPGLGASKVAYRTKKKVYVAFTTRDTRGAAPSKSFLTASLHENERQVQIRMNQFPKKAATSLKPMKHRT